MRKLATALYTALFFAAAHAALADEPKTAGEPPKGAITQAMEIQATVTAIDLYLKLRQ